jgi:hypothetical protein
MGYLGSGGFDPGAYMLQQLMKELFDGSGSDAELEEMQKELTKLRLEQAKDPSTLNVIEKRLDAYVSSVDMRKPENVEIVYNKINTALETKMFGNKPENIEFVKNYRDGLTASSTFLTEVADKRKNLYNDTNSSNVRRILDSAMMNKDTSNAIQIIENEIYNLTSQFDYLEDRGKLGIAQKNRYSNALQQYDNILKEFGTDGLTEKELKSIKNSTYAQVKTAETELDLELNKINVIREFISPTTKDTQLHKSLTNIHRIINEYDDFDAEARATYGYSNILESNALSTPSPENQKLEDNIMFLETNREERVLQRHAESYQKAFDLYTKNRKENKGKFELIDFTEMMDATLHEELYNHPTFYNKGAPDSNIFPLVRPKSSEQKKVISNMLSKRNIHIIDDIYDENGILWAEKGNQLKGLGSVENWEIDKIDRYDDTKLSKIRIKIPGSLPIGTGVSGARFTEEELEKYYSDRYINLTLDNFTIEDDFNFSGAGYKKDKKWGKLSYNIFNNFYEQIKK